METKSPLKSLGVLGPLVALIVFGLNWRWPGLGITEASAGDMIAHIDAVAGLLLGIYGRWRATKQIA